jgi:hypothetical protein
MNSHETRIRALETSALRWRLSTAAAVGVLIVIVLGGADTPSASSVPLEKKLDDIAKLLGSIDANTRTNGQHNRQILELHRTVIGRAGWDGPWVVRTDKGR